MFDPCKLTCLFVIKMKFWFRVFSLIVVGQILFFSLLWIPHLVHEVHRRFVGAWNLHVVSVSAAAAETDVSKVNSMAPLWWVSSGPILRILRPGTGVTGAVNSSPTAYHRAGAAHIFNAGGVAAVTHARVEPFGGGGTDATRWLIEKSLRRHADAPTLV